MTKEEAIKKVTEDGWCFKEMREFHDDIDVAKAALKSNGYNLSHLTNRLKNNKELVLIAVNQVGMALQYASLELKNDKEVVEAAIENRPDAIDYVGSSQLDRSLYLKYIEKSPSSIKKASDEIRDDKEIALLLINSEPRFIEYLSPRLQDDKEIVKIAVKHHGHLLQYASSRLQDDDEIVNIAIKDNTDNYKYASKRLQEVNGTVNITIIKRVTKTIFRKYKCEVEIPKNIYLSGSFNEEDYFDDDTAECTLKNVQDEDEEYESFETNEE